MVMLFFGIAEDSFIPLSHVTDGVMAIRSVVEFHSSQYIDISNSSVKVASKTAKQKNDSPINVKNTRHVNRIEHLQADVSKVRKYSKNKFISEAKKRDLSNTIYTLTLEGEFKSDGNSDVLAYNIYRSHLSPVTISASNLLTSIDMECTTYNNDAVTLGSTCYYVVTALYEEGESEPSNQAFAEIIDTKLAETDELLPLILKLHANYPNPFNPTTTFSYELPNPCFVTLSILNTSGQLIETLVNKNLEPGFHSFVWHAGDLSSGVYFYQLQAGHQIKRGKCVLIR